MSYFNVLLKYIYVFLNTRFYKYVFIYFFSNIFPVKTCGRIKPPPFGNANCTHADLEKHFDSEEHLPVDTVCAFSCSKGRTLIGSSQRTCLPLAQWDGLKTSCKRKKLT